MSAETAGLIGALGGAAIAALIAGGPAQRCMRVSAKTRCVIVFTQAVETRMSRSPTRAMHVRTNWENLQATWQ